MSAQLDQLTALAANDPDALETQEWLDALEAVLKNEGKASPAQISMAKRNNVHGIDRKSTRLNSSHNSPSRMPSSA